ncbi:MAG: MMPL family transporter, partial [Elusimicrobia bacterium]|nr:MMPL family transporter [Elusimicrobiota bacterium]
RRKPKADNRALVLETARTTMVPCMYCNLTTIAGFNSLILCDVLPVTQFGWMMSVGLVVSMVLVFWLMPSVMVLLPKLPAQEESEWGAPAEFNFARIVDHHKPAIYVSTVLVTILTVVGIARLQVENSFINYFRKSTPIYQGMKFIDDELGGTTPLDIIVNLENKKAAPAAPAPAARAGSDEFSGFEEFEEEGGKSDPRYWYTAERIAVIEKIHDYAASLPETGKVLSLATLHKTAESLNQGKTFDDFSLALLYNTMSGKFRELLVTPYVNVGTNEARISLRVRDSLKTLRRGEFIRRVRKDLVEKVGLREDQFRISGLMLLYNNMLQSLYASQIKAIAGTLAALLAMFLILFRSFSISFVALMPQFLACLAILGIMGLTGTPLDVMTITIVSISVGIGVDDAIHYVYHFQEEVAKDRNYYRAMYACHLTIGNAMLYTSLAITAGFSILAFSKFVPTVLFGLLTGVAMMVACISSQMLLPALILLVKPFGPGMTELPDHPARPC